MPRELIKLNPDAANDLRLNSRFAAAVAAAVITRIVRDVSRLNGAFTKPDDKSYVPLTTET